MNEYIQNLTEVVHKAAYKVENYKEAVTLCSELYDSSFSDVHQRQAMILIKKVETKLEQAYKEAAGGMHGLNPTINFATGMTDRKLEKSSSDDTTDPRVHKDDSIMALDITLLEQAAQLFMDVEIFHTTFMKGGRDAKHPLNRGFYDSSDSGNAMKKHLAIPGDALTANLTPDKDPCAVLCSIIAEAYELRRSRNVKSEFNMVKATYRDYDSDTSAYSAAADDSEGESAASRKPLSKKAKKKKRKNREEKEVTFLEDKGYESAASDATVRSGYSTEGEAAPRPATPRPSSTSAPPPAPLKPALKPQSFPAGEALSLKNVDLITPRDLPPKMRKKLEREFRDRHRDVFKDGKLPETQICMRSSPSGLYASGCDPATATLRKHTTQCPHRHDVQLPRLSTQDRFELFRDAGFLYAGIPDLPDEGHGAGRGRGDRGRGGRGRDH